MNRDIKHQLFPLINMASGQIRISKQSIHSQKHQTGGKRRPFVAIDEGMIAAKVKKIRGRDFLRIGNQRYPARRRLRCSNSRLQQCAITQSCATAMRAQHLAMNGKDRRNVEMNQ